MSGALASTVSAPIEELEVGAYTVPTDAPEADGTLAWDATTSSWSTPRRVARPDSGIPTPMCRRPG